MTRNRNTRDISTLPLNKWEQSVKEWAEHRDVLFKVTSGGHHWQFRRSGWGANWWPASGKLHIGSKRLMAKTADDVLRLLTTALPMPKQEEAPWDEDGDTVSRVESLEKRLATMEDALHGLAESLGHNDRSPR